MKGIFKLTSLKNKIFLSIIIVIAFCAFISALIVNFVVEYQMTAKYRSEKEAAVESLSYSLKSVLDTHSYPQLKQIIDSSLIYENIAYIAVFDESGTVIESSTDDSATARNIDIENHDLNLSGQKTGSFEIGFSREYIDNFSRTTTLVLVVSVAVFLLLSGLALFLYMRHSVTLPIETITRDISRISPDNLSVRLQVKSQDEIGTLASSFNRMAEDLEQSHDALQAARDELEQKVELRTKGERRRAEQLRAINEVGRRISAILTLDELLPYVVTSLQETFNYYNVNIFLIDTDSDNLALKAGAGGYRKNVPAGYLIGLNEGIVGDAATSGEPLNAGDVGKESRYIPFEELSETRSELAIPIRIGNETLGVLDVHSTELNAFDEIDVFTASTLADQLAVAIENARLYQETRDIAVLEERNRMAREIHDTLAQGFTGIVLQLEAAEQALDDDAGRVQEHLDRARNLARESLNEARRSVWSLRPQALEQHSFITTLRQQLDDFTRDSGIKADFDTSGKELELSADIEDALLRIFQESLTNIKKHAGASQVKINLIFDEKTVGLIADDNGVGFDTEVPVQNRFGLISMRERVKLLGGSINIVSEIGKGTYIEVKIPVNGGTV